MHTKLDHMQPIFFEEANMNNNFDRTFDLSGGFYFNQVDWGPSWSTSVLQGLILNWSGFVNFSTFQCFVSIARNVSPCFNGPKLICLFKQKFQVIIFFISFTIVLWKTTQATMIFVSICHNLQWLWMMAKWGCKI